jgi:hypothetical protein
VQPEQCQVTEEVLSVLLAQVHDRSTVSGREWTTGEIFSVREQMSHLGREHTDYVAILAHRLKEGAL